MYRRRPMRRALSGWWLVHLPDQPYIPQPPGPRQWINRAGSRSYAAT